MKKRKQNLGQSFVEFILLLGLLSIISLGFLKAVNGGISSRWRYLVIYITSPSAEKLNTDINFP